MSCPSLPYIDLGVEEVHIQGDVDQDLALYLKTEFPEVDAKLIFFVDFKTGKKTKAF